MGDDRFSYLNASQSLASHLLDEEDERQGWDLPDDDVKVPVHLLPPYQDEDDESVLPSASHPSYPYGNPYTPRNLANANSQTLPSTLFRPASHAHSLATTLPVLNLRQLYAMTSFGEPRDRAWTEMGLDDLLADRKEPEAHQQGTQQGGDAPQPTGQNAGDHPVDEEEPMEAIEEE